MKALVLNALGRAFDLEDIDIAAPMGREALIEVKASGLCHTDLLFANHDIVPIPAVLGHEVAGVVAAVGPEVAQFRVGDHVVGSLAQTCGSCAMPLRPFLPVPPPGVDAAAAHGCTPFDPARGGRVPGPGAWRLRRAGAHP